MTSISRSRAALVARLIEGDGAAPREERGAAFDGGADGALVALLDKVRLRAGGVIDADVAAAKAAGITEDRFLELVICAAVGQAMRQYETASAALAVAAAKE